MKQPQSSAPAGVEPVTWAAFLAQIEQRLDVAEVGLPQGIVDVAPFVVPDGLGDLPFELVEWASALVARTRALEDAVTRARADVGRQLAASRRQPSVAAPPRPNFFDQVL